MGHVFHDSVPWVCILSSFYLISQPLISNISSAPSLDPSILQQRTDTPCSSGLWPVSQLSSSFPTLSRLYIPPQGALEGTGDGGEWWGWISPPWVLFRSPPACPSLGRRPSLGRHSWQFQSRAGACPETKVQLARPSSPAGLMTPTLLFIPPASHPFSFCIPLTCIKTKTHVKLSTEVSLWPHTERWTRGNFSRHVNPFISVMRSAQAPRSSSSVVLSSGLTKL